MVKVIRFKWCNISLKSSEQKMKAVLHQNFTNITNLLGYPVDCIDLFKTIFHLDQKLGNHYFKYLLEFQVRIHTRVNLFGEYIIDSRFN